MSGRLAALELRERTVSVETVTEAIGGEPFTFVETRRFRLDRWLPAWSSTVQAGVGMDLGGLRLSLVLEAGLSGADGTTWPCVGAGLSLMLEMGSLSVGVDFMAMAGGTSWGRLGMSAGLVMAWRP